MKIIQKLELLAALATLIAGLLNFFIRTVPDLKQMEDLGYSNKEVLLRAFLALILPGFLILIGAYFHTVKQSIIGLILILIFAGMMAFLTAVSFLLGDAFDGRPLLGISLGLCALATIVLAVCSTLLSPPRSRTAKLR